jgi:hypothetical protein
VTVWRERQPPSQNTTKKYSTYSAVWDGEVVRAARRRVQSNVLRVLKAIPRHWGEVSERAVNVTV